MPAVTELIIAELLYLQYKDRTKPIYLYINSTGTTRADGETVCALHLLPNSHALCCCGGSQTVRATATCYTDMEWLAQVGFETEGTAIYDTMQFVKNEVSSNPRWYSPYPLAPGRAVVTLNASSLLRYTPSEWEWQWDRHACCYQLATRASVSCFHMQQVRIGDFLGLEACMRLWRM